MGLSILFVFFIALPFFIYGEKTPTKFVNEVMVLNEYARNGRKIADNALILTENGFLGEGDIGFVYAGRLVVNDYPVAIKFFPGRHTSGAKKELKAYKQMLAYQNSTVEIFGIPTLHYSGKWKHQEKHFDLIAITKLGESLEEVNNTKHIYPLDIMILLKNFAIQSRYMHSHLIYHGDLDSSNIMIRPDQSFIIGSFIIDFNRAREMKKEETFLLTHQDLIDFFYMILKICNIETPGSWDTWEDTLPPGKISDPEFLRVIKAFGDEAFSSDNSKYFPNYDRLVEFIDEEIKKYLHRTDSQLKFSWFANR